MTHDAPSPKSTQQRVLTILSATALAFGLAACNRQDEQTVGQKIDATIERTGEAASDAQRRMEAAATEASQASRQAAARAAEVMDDAGITAKVTAGLAQDAELSAIKIDVDTRNGIVTLSGPVKNDVARERASRIAENVKGVNSVVNQLTVAPGATG
ncbi:BON domain-containing protein [Acidovorax sp. NCPPB 4044]|uniref:BON domain-containing protein n=1 Tax=Acidovorax sp. NCPPB 4044 TaxID=2940490 RepID=UPI0023047A80|nr:BON domain-containing protein [Acidovorax sp. NCPPB 4044]MDA8520822.1 BON domain-containing protein [Acidovorax sp. NCPPB 4044]